MYTYTYTYTVYTVHTEHCQYMLEPYAFEQDTVYFRICAHTDTSSTRRQSSENAKNGKALKF